MRSRSGFAARLDPLLPAEGSATAAFAAGILVFGVAISAVTRIKDARERRGIPVTLSSSGGVEEGQYYACPSRLSLNGTRRTHERDWDTCFVGDSV
jgi:hypothetical protein